MARPRLFTVYALTVALVGLGLAVVTTVLQAPHDLHSFRDDIVTRGLILLILTFLSSFAPMKTRYGASLAECLPWSTASRALGWRHLAFPQRPATRSQPGISSNPSSSF